MVRCRSAAGNARYLRHGCCHTPVSSWKFSSSSIPALSLGVLDPPEIVIDEVAGLLVTIILIPFTWPTLIAGFFLFRFFDILKPPPIKGIEKKIKGGVGVVLDDLVAGAYAHISLRLLIWLFN